MDSIDIEILEDGTIKFKTGSISQINHKSADEFLNEIEELTGERKTTPRKQSASMNLRSYDRKLKTFQK